MIVKIDDKLEESGLQRYNKILEAKSILIDIRRALDAEYSRYKNVLKEVHARKGLKRKDRINLDEVIRQQYIKNIDKIRIKYKETFQYIKSNGLNENDFCMLSIWFV